MANPTLTVIDNRTGQRYELPIENGAVRAVDLAQIKTDATDPGIVSYDPVLDNTATCKSKISYIDGARGILRYRGYPIEQLAAHSTFLETAYLIVKGELPTSSHYAMWQHNIKTHTLLHENVLRFIEGFRYDAHPMGILIGTVGALSTFYPDARNILDLESRRMQTRRLIGKIPTLAAFAYRHSRGLPYVYPDNELSYTGNFLSMIFRMTELTYAPNPVFERALEVLFILHADQGQSCGVATARTVGSAYADPYCVVAAAAAALSGRRHGAANVNVIEMLREIDAPARVPEIVRQVKAGERALRGFGHAVFGDRDPRIPIIRTTAHEVFEVTGRSPLIDTALELDRIARDDEWFATRKLTANVDFYSGLIYTAMGIPPTMFSALLAIARTAGWMAHWAEMLLDENQQHIVRPKQLYVGYDERAYVPLEQRREGGALETEVRGPL